MADTKDQERKDSKAVALQYERESDPAPKLIAKGEGHIADQLLKIAEEHDIPIREDASLVEILAALDIDEFIPMEAYAAVAEILSYIYKQEEKGAKG